LATAPQVYPFYQRENSASSLRKRKRRTLHPPNDLFISAQNLDLTKFRGLRRVHNDKGGNPMRVCCISSLKFMVQAEQKERFATILFFRQEIAGVPVDGPVSY
jgi:hypothetical protein